MVPADAGEVTRSSGGSDRVGRESDGSDESDRVGRVGRGRATALPGWGWRPLVVRRRGRRRTLAAPLRHLASLDATSPGLLRSPGEEFAGRAITRCVDASRYEGGRLRLPDRHATINEMCRP